MLNRNTQTVLAALLADPRHLEADLWIDNDPGARYATLSILFLIGLRIEVQLPRAKARLLAVIQLVFDSDREQGELPSSISGMRLRGEIGEEYRKFCGNAVPLSEGSVTAYMCLLQKAIKLGIKKALGLEHDGKFPDFLFERGTPWGVCMRDPGVRVHHRRSPLAA